MYHGWYPIISEEDRLKNLVVSCEAQLRETPENEYWQNLLKGAHARLGEIYEAEYCDDMSDFRLSQKAKVSL